MGSRGCSWGNGGCRWGGPKTKNTASSRFLKSFSDIGYSRHTVYLSVCLCVYVCISLSSVE